MLEKGESTCLEQNMRGYLKNSLHTSVIATYGTKEKTWFKYVNRHKMDAHGKYGMELACGIMVMIAHFFSLCDNSTYGLFSISVCVVPIKEPAWASGTWSTFQPVRNLP
jgi:hypothetical protein